MLGENGVRWANFTKTSLKYTKFKSLKFLSLQIIQIHSFAIYILQNLRNVITFCDRNLRLKFFGKMAQLTPHTGKVDPPIAGVNWSTCSYTTSSQIKAIYFSVLVSYISTWHYFANFCKESLSVTLKACSNLSIPSAALLWIAYTLVILQFCLNFHKIL